MQDIYGTEKKRTIKKLHNGFLFFFFLDLSLGVGKNRSVDMDFDAHFSPRSLLFPRTRPPE